MSSAEFGESPSGKLHWSINNCSRMRSLANANLKRRQQNENKDRRHIKKYASRGLCLSRFAYLATAIWLSDSAMTLMPTGEAKILWVPFSVSGECSPSNSECDTMPLSSSRHISRTSKARVTSPICTWNTTLNLFNMTDKILRVKNTYCLVRIFKSASLFSAAVW